MKAHLTDVIELQISLEAKICFDYMAPRGRCSESISLSPMSNDSEISFCMPQILQNAPSVALSKKPLIPRATGI